MKKVGISPSRGFTIVELLIVIVVIGILAALVITAYNGIQNRANYARAQSDIKAINKGILAYYAANGSYPYPSGNTGTYYSFGYSPSAITIPGLVPDFMSKIPNTPQDGTGGYYVYIASANGVDYKILRLMPGGTPLPSVELSNSNLDYRTNSDGSRRGWGYWSSGGSGF